jgi:hypothetical protein
MSASGKENSRRSAIFWMPKKRRSAGDETRSGV